MVRPRPGFTRRLILALVALTAMMAASIWLNFSASNTLQDVRRGVAHSASIIFANDELFSLVQDLEVGQRGYLLTRRAAYLEPYRQSAAKVLPALERLRDRMALLPEYTELTAQLDRLIPLKLREIARTIELAEEDRWDEALTVVDSDIGKNTMSAVRQISDRIQELTVQTRARTLEDADMAQERLRLSSIAIGVLALIGAFLAIFNLVRVNAGLQVENIRRRSIEAGLREMEGRNRAFFEHSADYLYIVEEDEAGDWRYRQVNPAMARLFKLPIKDVIGKRINDLVDAETAATGIAYYRHCRDSGAAMRYQNRGPFETGVVEFDVSLMPLPDADGKVRRILGSARDVTQNKVTEAALRQSQKMEAVGQLTGGVAHDFNNLLQVVLGNLELARRNVTDKATLDRLAAVTAAADRGKHLTRKLLTFARQTPNTARVLAPDSILRKLESMVRASLGEAVALQVAIGEGIWPVEVDRTSLETAILNLSINARDAMPNGGTVKIGVGNVVVGEAFAAAHADAHAGDHVRITVSDTGTGISPELLDKVFIPFFTTKPAGKGTGLGLAMVYSLVRDRGGFATIDTEQGLGTTVSLYFPRSDRKLATDTAGPTAADGGEESVLVVDDNQYSLETTAEMLRGLGYKVVTAGDGETALTMLTRDQDFDLLLTDVIMPGVLNGVTLARRAQALRPDLRILFMSGYIDDAAVREAASSGNLLVLHKPFDSGQLAASVRGALDRAGAMRAGVTRAGGAQFDFRHAQTGRSILVVEDDALVRVVAVDALTLAGFRCIEAETAAEALDCLRDDTIGISAMVTDLRLPDQPGEVVLREAARVRPSMPVLVATGAPQMPAEIAASGAIDTVTHIAKPYSPEMLVRRIIEMTR